MELTLDQALQQGVEAHKAGQVQDADRLYTAILKAQPKHPDANHNMGVLAVGVDKVQEALPFFKVALEVNPSIAQFWLSYIDAFIKLERLAAAKAKGVQLGAYRDGVYVGGKGNRDTARNATEAKTALFRSNALDRLPMLKRVDPEGSMSLRAIADTLNDMKIPTVSTKGRWSANSVRRLKAISQ